jgi:hypothetical protein
MKGLERGGSDLGMEYYKKAGAGESCLLRRLRPEEITERYCICHSKNNQYVGIWTPVTGMKMRFCERHIRVNRQELD